MGDPHADSCPQCGPLMPCSLLIAQRGHRCPGLQLSSLLPSRSQWSPLRIGAISGQWREAGPCRPFQETLGINSFRLSGLSLPTCAWWACVQVALSSVHLWGHALLSLPTRVSQGPVALRVHFLIGNEIRGSVRSKGPRSISKPGKGLLRHIEFS